MKLDLGNKTITIRKWKGKDRKKFISALNKLSEVPDLTSEMEIMQALVYSCIEEDVVLSLDEFRYVLSRIRAYSLGEEVSLTLECPSCATVHTSKHKLSNIIRFENKGLTDIVVGDVTLELSEPSNREIYIAKVAEDPIYDLILRIREFGDAYTSEEIEEALEDLDIDVLDKILEIYEDRRFKVKDIAKIQCPKCEAQQLYSFDEIPGFFPDEWFKQ